MTLYPVIMCGGAGTRLWPASRPSRPKQFIPLSGNRSLFQEAVLRVAPLTADGGRLLVVGGVAHREAILNQLAEVGVSAQILLEPEARDSAAAMAVAAAWTIQRDPDGINIFVAADHHIPDHDAFCEAALQAAAAARDGLIVTLGVRPTEPSAAYGYIAAEGDGLSAVKAFVEKPNRETAERYIAAGYLWNSGNFIVSAATLLSEMRSAAPAVEAAARESLMETGDSELVVLGAAFRNAPKISIDYAVMEKTLHASVLTVNFEWSDLGAWDAVAATGEGDLGNFVFEDAEGCMSRAPEGVVVAAIGVRNLAIIVEQDAVLVCDLNQSQAVKKVVERLRLSSPQHLDFSRPLPENLEEGGERFTRWLKLRALPVWSALGQASDGGFAEMLALDGRRINSQRRARVQARQVQVFADAGRLGWNGPWRQAVTRGLARIEQAYLRPDGLMRTLLCADGSPLDETAMLYDQAFHLFALASAQQAGVDGPHEARATAIRDLILAAAPVAGGLVETSSHPFQSNCHMHLLEAALAWEQAGQDGDGHDAGWRLLSDRIVTLAQQYFIDPEGGFLREFFSENWLPASGDDGRLVEPGHQFEWAWLLARYGRQRGDAAAIAAARRLYAFGLKGVSVRRGVAMDAMTDDGNILNRRARLWPQTEWMKASLILAELNEDGEQGVLLDQAARALRALWLYLTDDGLWRDKLLENGVFIDEPAPASSLYHIMAAWVQLQASAKTTKIGGEPLPEIGSALF